MTADVWALTIPQPGLQDLATPFSPSHIPIALFSFIFSFFIFMLLFCLIIYLLCALQTIVRSGSCYLFLLGMLCQSIADRNIHKIPNIPIFHIPNIWHFLKKKDYCLSTIVMKAMTVVDFVNAVTPQQ